MFLNKIGRPLSPPVYSLHYCCYRTATTSNRSAYPWRRWWCCCQGLKVRGRG